jgi:hypothetical protein
MIDIVGLGKDSVDISTPPGELVRSFFNTGEKIVKLDVTADVVPKDGKLLVTLKFINSGKTEIAFKSPATWEGTYNPLAGNSYASVGAGPEDGGFYTGFFGAEQMVNRRDYPDDVVRIQSGQFAIATFLVYPDDKIKKGIYKVGGSALIKTVLAPKQLAGRIEFIFQDSKVAFATDYPVNQKELGEFEAYRRAKLFRRIHGIADEVEETGYYRAFGEKEERDDFPQLLKKGDKFPSRDIQQLNCGSPWRNGATAKMWRWEAYPEAQMTTNHRAECPRSGMWVPTIPSNRDAFLDAQLAGLLAVRWVDAGALMPPLWLENADAERSVVWEWLGDQKA